MFLLTTLIFAGLTSEGWTRPILPVPYQVMYLNDPLGFHFPTPPQPILSNRVSDDPSSHQNDDDHSYEVTQFHTEDDGGRIVYGFQSPDQVRMEAREADGTVRGSYSYVDAFGNIVKMQYWDDGNGIHMAGNNLPVAFHEEPQYTPEVRAAREEHFRLYEAALATLRAAGLDDSPESEPEQYPSSDIEGDPNSQSVEDVPEEEAPPPDDSVILENESAVREPIPDYQKMPFSQDTPLNLPPTDDNDDEESIAVDNPEFIGSGWSRRAKSHGSPLRMSPPLEMDAASTDQVALKNGWNNDDEARSKAVKLEEPQEDKTTIKKVGTELTKPTEKKDMLAKDTASDVNPAKSLTEEKVETVPVPEGRAFFYQFAHQIPQPEERVDEHSETGRSVPTIQDSPPSQVSVADQLSRLQQEQAVQRQESSKLLETPKFVESPHESSPMKHVPQLPEKPSQDSSVKSVSNRAVELGAIPIDAVHDAQVSPFQRRLLPSYQLYPVFIPPTKN